MVISPTLPFSLTISSSRSSLLRSFSAAFAANKARSRHSDNRAAVTLAPVPPPPVVRPASSRLTARSFRFTEKRCGGPPPALGPAEHHRSNILLRTGKPRDNCRR